MENQYKAMVCLFYELMRGASPIAHKVRSKKFPKMAVCLSVMTLVGCDSDTQESSPSGQWEFLAIDGMRCRDGSDTGIAIRETEASDKLLILLQEGGACDNALTCSRNRDSYSIQDFDTQTFDGLLSSEESVNPNFHDWTMVFVPYCTGDVHAGANTGQSVPPIVISEVPIVGSLTLPGVEDQHFVGFTNMQTALEVLEGRLPSLERVVLAGQSAGGFGAMIHAQNVRNAFPNTRLSVLSDSAFPADEPLNPACLQNQWAELWGGENTVLNQCPECEAGTSYFETAVYNIFAIAPDVSMGIISSTRDLVLRLFFTFGYDECRGAESLTFEEACRVVSTFRAEDPELLNRLGSQVAQLAEVCTSDETGVVPSGAEYTEALLESYTNGVVASPFGFSTYTIESTDHIFTGSALSSTEVNGVSLNSWIDTAINNDCEAEGTHVGLIADDIIAQSDQIIESQAPGEGGLTETEQRQQRCLEIIENNTSN